MLRCLVARGIGLRVAVSAGATAAFAGYSQRAEAEEVAPPHAHTICGRQVLVSVPVSYEEQVLRRKRFNVVYVLDSGPLFSLVTEAARADHAAVQGVKGRQWHPDLIIVGVRVHNRGETSAACLDYVREWLVPIVDAQYATNPYAAGRAICGHADAGGDAVRRLLVEERGETKLFRYFLLGAPAAATSGEGATAAPMAPKSAVFLSCAGDEACGGQLDEERTLAQAVRQRTAAASTDTTIVVDRHGEQHYTSHEASLGPAVTVDVVEGRRADEADALAVALAQRGMHWLGGRLEEQKLEALGSLLPWHEFK